MGERYKVEKWGGPTDPGGYWCLVDTLQQRMLIGPESFAVCDGILERLNNRTANDEIDELDEVAAIIAANA